MGGENRKPQRTVVWFYSKQHEEGWRLLGSHWVALFPSPPFLPPLPSLSSLSSWCSHLFSPGSLWVGQSAGGETGGVMRQIWQLPQHQPLVCLSSCRGDQRAPAAGIGPPVFRTSSSRGEEAAWDGKVFVTGTKRLEGGREGGLLTSTSLFL